MTTYKEIKGTQIEVLASDPSNPVEGQVWYNSTSNVLKGQAATTVGAWSTGGSLNTGRRSMAGAGASSSSALGFGGFLGPPPNTMLDLTEKYNGTSWTEVNDMNNARRSMGGAGTQTSALAFGGNQDGPPTDSIFTESWNGTNWTEVNDMNTARQQMGDAGADNTSALAFGGAAFPTMYANTESWNGTNWTEVNDLTTARYGLSGFGIITSALAFGGETPPNNYKAITESWNGTNWTEVNDLSFNRSFAGAAGADNTSGLVFGGYDHTTDVRTNKVELWNGTNWTEQADLSDPAGAFIQNAGAGTATSAIAFGGEGPSNQMKTQTEEWLGAGASVTRTFTDS